MIINNCLKDLIYIVVCLNKTALGSGFMVEKQLNYPAHSYMVFFRE
jgi:hypothetical protein